MKKEYTKEERIEFYKEELKRLKIAEETLKFIIRKQTRFVEARLKALVIQD